MAAQLSLARRILKQFHAEGLPWIGTVIYGALSETMLFQRHYDRIVRDVRGYCSSGEVLDIGTGPAWLMIKLCQACPELRVTGVDVSPTMVRRARENLAKAGLAQREVRHENASRLSFPDNHFDLVVSTWTIHHWKNVDQALHEIHRVLRPGGRALMYDGASNFPKEAYAEASREFGRLRTAMMWVHSFEEPFYSCEQFARLASSTPFQAGELRYAGVLCCLVLKKPSSRVGG